MRQHHAAGGRIVALVSGVLASLALAGCGMKSGPAGDATAPPSSAVAAPATTPIDAATSAAAAAPWSPAIASPSTLSASWLRSATPWTGWLAPTSSPVAAGAAQPVSADLLAGWKAFSPPGADFSVSLPGEPSPGVQTLPTPAGPVTLHTFLAMTGDAGYYVGYADYPAGIMSGVDPARVLDGARDGALASVHGTLLGEQDATLAGLPAREVTITAPYAGLPQGLYVVARFALSGSRQYQVQAASAGKPSAADAARFEAFFDSFSLTQSGAQ